MRVVLDTNILVSAIVFDSEKPLEVLRRAFDIDDLLISEAVMDEYERVLTDIRFERFVPEALRRASLSGISEIATLVDAPVQVKACRDPKDDKFLQLAIAGRADCIVTGDLDLRDLHPFEGIDIFTASEYLSRHV